MPATLNCPRCTTPIPEHSRYCLSCGASVSGDGERTADFDPSLQAQLQEELGGEFTIERELGRGGMAAVYLAHDTRLGRKLAVKVLPPEFTFGHQDAVERFRREARTAATLDHPHIIPIYRVSGEGRLVWYAMKYLPGDSLDKLLQRVWRLSVDATARVVEQIAAALEHAHEQGVVHRDVKPANAVIDAKGWVTVTDFGIAKAMDSATLTGTGSTIGTPFYMSPEQCSGTPVTGASDQYALGVMTYQMLAGRVPYTGSNVVEIIRRHCFDSVPPLLELRPELTPPVVQVIERALAKKPEERFPSVMSFAKALDLAARGVDIGISYPDTSDPLNAADTVIINERVKDRRKVPRGKDAVAPVVSPSRWRPVAIGVAVVALTAVAAGAVLRPWDRATPGGQDTTATPASQLPLATQPPPPSPPYVAPVPPAAPPPAETAKGDQPVRQSTARRVTPPPAAAPAPVPAAADSAWISVGSIPSSQVSINGRAFPSPVRELRVPAGAVRLVFQATDSIGPIRWDTTITLRAGDRRTLGYINLRVRQP